MWKEILTTRLFLNGNAFILLSIYICLLVLILVYLFSETMGLPAQKALPHDTEPVPYHIVADDAFAMRTWLMKPYPQRDITRSKRIFNYRLSRARRIVENAFGILAHRFRCLLTTLELQPEKVQSVVMAACVLHNLILTRNPRPVIGEVDSEDPNTHEVVRGAWRDELGEEYLQGLESLPGNTATKSGKQQRDFLTIYYNNIGSVPWQANVVFGNPNRT